MGRGLSWRRLGVLIRQLPYEARLTRVQGGPQVEWNVDTYLLAAIVDAINAGNWQRGGGKSAKPRPVPRPGDEKPGMGTAVPLDELRRRLHPELFEGGD